MKQKRFIPLVQIDTKMLNGNIVEAKEWRLFNISRIVSVIPSFSEDRCALIIDGYEDRVEVEIGFNALEDMLNE